MLVAKYDSSGPSTLNPYNRRDCRQGRMNEWNQQHEQLKSNKMKKFKKLNKGKAQVPLKPNYMARRIEEKKQAKEK